MMTMISTTKDNGNDSGNGGSGDHVTVAGFHERNGAGKGNVGNGGDGESHLKKGPWTVEEDAILMDYVTKHGEGNWNAVQRYSGLVRCGKSCRLRWANHLRPNLKKGAFSPEEERLIVELHAKFGNKWARMASLLPGRTDNEIKNYWNTRVKRHQRQGLPLYPPDIQPQHPPSPHFHHRHHHHHYHNKSPSVSIPTTPTSSFSFQTHYFPSPNTPTHHHHPHTPSTPPPLSPTNTSTSFPTLPLFDFSQAHLNLHHHSSTGNSYSTPTTPTSSFSFQTYQLQEPATPIHSSSVQVHHISATTPPPDLSPLSSPSTTPTPSNFPTLPLFDFNLPKSPPILQTPMRFKRFSSLPNVSALSTYNLSNMNANSQYSMPLSPLPSAASEPNTTGHQSPTCFVDLTSSEFHTEMQKENQEMCTLLAAVTQQELPSNQFLSPNNHHDRNMGIGIATSKFGGRVTKNKIGNSLKDKINEQMRFTLEDLLQETVAVSEGGQTSTDDNIMVSQEHKPKLFISEGYATEWDQSISLDLSPGNDLKAEGTEQLKAMPEELTKVLSKLPSSMQAAELYSDSGDISNGPSSVITDDNINIGFEMQQIASLFPPAENGRSLGSCSWDNLPGIC